ncbi:protein LURP-one-related [Salix suchowensis]|nr:protein LURP-one-related [Salix suchowensis]
MSRIHPSDQSRCHGHSLLRDHEESRRPLHDHDKRHQLLPPPTGTDGFTVFDPNGTLVFRVDNYSRKNGYGLVLMDGVGNALLSLKPKYMLSMQYQWNAYIGEDECGEDQSVLNEEPSMLFHSAGRNILQDRQDFYWEVVANISRKRVNNTTILLSDDVFSLVVQPGFDSQLIMAFLIVLDRISSKPFSPVMCS